MKQLILLMISTIILGISTSTYALTPKSKAIRLYESYANKDWETAAKFFHPEDLDSFKQMMTPVLLDELNMVIPQRLEERFGQEVTEDYIKNLNPETFFSKFIWSILYFKQIKFLHVSPIGSFIEGEISHEAIRITYKQSGLTISDVIIVSMRKYQGVWKVLFDGQIQEWIAQVAKRK